MLTCTAAASVMKVSTAFLRICQSSCTHGKCCGEEHSISGRATLQVQASSACGAVTDVRDLIVDALLHMRSLIQVMMM